MPAFAGMTAYEGSEMPTDIDPQSGCRLPLRKRETMDEVGQRAFDRANTPGKTIVGLRGPAGLHLYSTKTVDAHNEINRYLRHEAGFDPKIREVAILTVAREMDSRFEWAAHEPEALKVGVAPDAIDVIKHRKSTAGLSEIEAAIIEFGRQAVGKHTVDAAAYVRLKAFFTPEQLVDLVLLMGNYAGTAVLLAAFDMQVADGRPLLPVD